MSVNPNSGKARATEYIKREYRHKDFSCHDLAHALALDSKQFTLASARATGFLNEIYHKNDLPGLERNKSKGKGHWRYDPVEIEKDSAQTVDIITTNTITVNGKFYHQVTEYLMVDGKFYLPGVS